MKGRKELFEETDGEHLTMMKAYDLTPANNVYPVMEIKSDDHKIFRKIDEDGSVAYYHPLGGEARHIESYELSVFFNIIFERYESLALMLTEMEMWNSEARRFRVLLESLNSSTKQQTHALMEFLKDAIGYVEVDVVSHKDGFYRPGRIVGMNVLELSREFKVGRSQGKGYDCKI